MADVAPQFEIEDVQGNTVHYSGTVGITSALIPAVAAQKIGNALVRCPISNSKTQTLQVAFDGGTTYLTLNPGEFVGWSPRKNASGTPITQVRILGGAANTAYEIVLDYEP